MTHKKSFKKDGKKFWEKEYQSATHLAMSTNHSSDLETFMRWMSRQKDPTIQLTPPINVLDIGCGNGRNIIFLEKNESAHGSGFDISSEAISQAQSASECNFFVHDLHEMPYPLDNESHNLVLDMMSSHILSHAEREHLRQEIDRILVPGGWIFYKTFLLDGDANAKEMIHKNPGPEKNSYIHPKIGNTEYVLSEEQLIDEVQSIGWIVHRVSKSHRHIKNGVANKRRTISLYLQKPLDW